TPGWKFSEYEMRGVPLRLEIGPRDVKAGTAPAVRRDSGSKETVPLAGLAGRVPELLDDIQKSLFDQALAFREANTRRAATYAEFKAIMERERGFIRALWCGGDACEDKIKEETQATIRVLPLTEEAPADGACVCCGGPARTPAVFAKSY
ncbi:MAG: proline--tRNA ligase, partial [Candidatus Aminicenantes bacterium]|nr:proline--tRNA ligase [Candidatus Aminicenantes bacterium]